MPLDPELAAWLRLSLTPQLTGAGLRRLLAAYGDPLRILSAGRAPLAQHVPGAAAAALAQEAAPPGLAATAAWLEERSNHVVTLADEAYPRLLLEIPDPPALLYVKGRRELLNRPALAIVGSRNATAQGIANAEAFARALSDAGLLIVSGLALGVDAAAHRGGLAGAAASVAVVGTGLDIVDPARNRALAHELAERGALVSEFPLGTPARAVNFPRRNRLLSGLATGTLVVEAAIGSGSLITARAALEQGREVFAIPGSIHSPLAKGCHALLKQGAKLVESAADVLEELRLAPAAQPPAPRTTRGDVERLLLEALGYDPVDPDSLCARTGLAAAQVSALLTQFELEGAVMALPGGRFQRVR
ncbi:MAG: DNA-protecting protein DprA [Burkholderiales bacterium]|nr:DNA-protecting protein DprA [Burkholderiales bacterium]